MSYSNELKRSIQANEPKKVCCSRALSCGLFLGASRFMRENSEGRTEELLCFSTEEETVAHLSERLLALRFGRDAEIEVGSRPGHKTYTLTFSSKPLSKLLRTLEMPTSEELKCWWETIGLRCAECRAAFFRGLFLGCGSVSDPASSFHLEFSLPASRAESVAVILSDEIEPPRRVARRDKTGLYYKKSTVIGEFFSRIGENGLYFEFADKQIERQIRAVENRLTNCEMKNLEKTVNATIRQIAAVKALFLSGEIERLPQELRETAVLRLEYDDDSLSKLAGRHVPPITKSGLNNRLRRIMEAADELECFEALSNNKPEAD